MKDTADQTDQVFSENRDRFLRLNGPRTEKAVKALETLSQTANRKSYDYTPEEAQACWSQIEEAARVLYERLSPVRDDLKAP